MKRRRHVLLAMAWESPNVQRGVLIYAKEHHWLMEIPNPHDVELVRHWQGDGVICTLFPNRQHPMTRLLLAKPAPLVEMTRSMKAVALPRVLEDNDRVGRMGAEYFLNKGFRHFLFVTRFRHNWPVDERVVAFQAALAERGLTTAVWRFDEWHCPNRLVAEMGARLRQLPKPLAVFCGFDDFSCLVLNACLATRIAVPESVAILGTGNEELRCDWARVPLSRVRAYTERQGYQAAQLLDRILEGRADPLTELRVPPDGIVERASTATLAIHDPHIHRALDYIQTNLHRSIHVTDVARHAGLSHCTLARKFRQGLNHGIVDEINQRRIEEVKKLLLTSDTKAHVIGASLGFFSPYYFYRVFRRVTGQTTRQYRAQHQNTQASPAAQSGTPAP